MAEELENKPAEPETLVSIPSADSLPTSDQNHSDKVVRFHIPERVEHWTFMISFTTLALTGLIQKFFASPISQTIVKALGGIENVRIIHRVSATIMMVVVIYHVGEIIYKMYVRSNRPSMLPSMLDIKNAWQTVRYNLMFSNKPPQQARYSFEEKMEYWAVVWGTVVMIFTGFMMWNPIATTNFLPGEVIPAAKLAHGLEAILAVLAIIIWHFYHVLIKTLNRSMFNGRLSLHQMEEEHPIELADIKAGLDKPYVSPEVQKKRQRIFLPVYSVVALLGVVGIVWFVSFEKTAITTVPVRETAQVFVPETPTPFPTPLPSATPMPTPEGGLVLTSWEAGIGDLFDTKCGGCHNSASKIGGLDLTSYSGALTGGNAGPGIIPSDPENSNVVKIQQAGGHPGQLSAAELDAVIQWIQNGAPEN